MHSKFMQRCLSLAKLGIGHVPPNPMVGSVIVYEGRILSEGYHQKLGESHAERKAISRVKDKDLLRNSTLYVNLEPCSHHGKTPPCADLIVEMGIPEVIVGCLDPNPLVAGKGIEKLRQAGITVIEGILDDESRWLNRRFFTNQTAQRPYVILKWAKTKDGYLDLLRDSESSPHINWITGPELKQLVHKWRTEESAILVGGRTLIHDNPSLTAREYFGENPTRIAIDTQGGLPSHLDFFDTKARSILLKKKDISFSTPKNIILEDIDDNDSVAEMLERLYNAGISSIIIEGGQVTLERFLQSGLWDEARILTGDKSFGAGLRAPALDHEPDQRIGYGKELLEVYYSAGLLVTTGKPV